jgi:hypothetical protein
MYEFASFVLKFGNWMDVAEGRDLHNAVQLDLGEQDLPDAEALQRALRECGLNPWETIETRRHYYANASSSSLEVVVAVAPLLADPIWRGSVEAIAEHLVTKLLSLFDRKPDWDVGDADAAAKRMLLYQVRLSDADISQKLAQKRADGSWVFVYHDARKREDHLVMVSEHGVCGHANLKFLESAKVSAQEQQNPQGSGSSTRG